MASVLEEGQADEVTFLILSHGKSVRVMSACADLSAAFLS